MAAKLKGELLMKSLKSKFAVAMCSICILVLFSSILIGYNVSYNALNTEITQQTLTTSEKYSEIINSWLSVQGKTLEDIADSLDNYSTFNKTDIISYLAHKAKSNPYATDVYIGFSDKSFWDGAEWTPDAGYDCTSRNWYKEAIEKNKEIYTAPYLDAMTKK